MTQVSPLNDGVDHINVYSKGVTQLGRMLTNLYNQDFSVPGYGDFKSMEGFWYYYLTGCVHEEFKGYGGFDAKKNGKLFRDDRIDKDGLTDEQKSVILEAIRCKLRQNRPLLRELYQSDLPFKHYYFYGKPDNAKVIELPQYDWMLEEFTRIRGILKEQWGKSCK